LAGLLQFATIRYKCSKLEKFMSMPVRIDDELYEQARAASKGECRTIAGQLEFWAKVGKAALDNPDLPIEFVRELLIARAEDRKQRIPFKPGQFRA
jgi:hypothetical protein